MARKDPQALVGQWLPGGYRLRKLVGQGAFAWVYQATTAQNALVAIKVLQSTSDEARTMFTREVKVLRALPPSEYCVQFYDDGVTDEGLPFFAMEFVDGCTLKDALRFKPLWEIPEACNLMLQLCAALVGLHRLGVAHRDLKPENVLLTQDWQVKLTDFGLVKDAQGLLKLFETEDILTGRDFEVNIDRAMLAGTPEYMAPEQFMDPMQEDESKAQTDTWTDVYSLGLIFYQILTSEKLFPFEADNSSQGAYARSLLQYVRSRTAFDDRQLERPGPVPPALWPLIVKTLKQDPRRRFHTAGELYDAIEGYATHGRAEFAEEEHTRMADMSELFAQLESGRAEPQAMPAPEGFGVSPSNPAPRRSDSIRVSAKPRSVFPSAPPHGVVSSDFEPTVGDVGERFGGGTEHEEPATVASGPLDIAAVRAFRERRLNAPGMPDATFPPHALTVEQVYAGARVTAPRTPHFDDAATHDTSNPFGMPLPGAAAGRSVTPTPVAYDALSIQQSGVQPLPPMPLMTPVSPQPPIRSAPVRSRGPAAAVWIGLIVTLLAAAGAAAWWMWFR